MMFVIMVLWTWGSDYRMEQVVSEDQACKAVAEYKLRGAKLAKAYVLSGNMDEPIVHKLFCPKPEGGSK